MPDPRDPHAPERLAAREAAYAEAMRESDTARTEHLTMQAVIECALCDDEGYRPNRTVCDHKDRSDVGRSQREQIREMLTKGNR